MYRWLCTNGIKISKINCEVQDWKYHLHKRCVQYSVVACKIVYSWTVEFPVVLLSNLDLQSRNCNKMKKKGKEKFTDPSSWLWKHQASLHFWGYIRPAHDCGVPFSRTQTCVTSSLFTDEIQPYNVEALYSDVAEVLTSSTLPKFSSNKSKEIEPSVWVWRLEEAKSSEHLQEQQIH